MEARKEGLVIHSPSQRVGAPGGNGFNAKFRQAVEYVAAKENRIIVFPCVMMPARFLPGADLARANGAVTSRSPPRGGDLDPGEFFNRKR